MQSLVDPFGRVQDYLRISLTERCNLRCTYCMPAGGIPLRPRALFMDAGEVLAIARTFVELGVKKIRLTGGEPLVRRDAGEVIRALSTLPVELALTTNGLLVHRFIRTFREAGLRSVNVSLDSLKREKLQFITRRDCLYRVRSNIDLLLGNGFEVKLNTVMMRGVNDEEITDFIELTRHKAVHCRFIEFMPFAGNGWSRDKLVGTSDLLQAIEAAYPGMVEGIEGKPQDTASKFRIRNHAGTFGFISSATEPFCGGCSRMRLTADGHLKNCLFSTSESDLLTALRRGEPLHPLILDSALRKKAARGGRGNFEEIAEQGMAESRRTMTATGG